MTVKGYHKEFLCGDEIILYPDYGIDQMNLYLLKLHRLIYTHKLMHVKFGDYGID